MKKNVFIFFVLSSLYISQLQADYVNIDYMKKLATTSCNSVCQLYNQHTHLTHILGILVVCFCLYKTYCPVESRCKKCLENSSQT